MMEAAPYYSSFSSRRLYLTDYSVRQQSNAAKFLLNYQPQDRLPICDNAIPEKLQRICKIVLTLGPNAASIDDWNTILTRR
jgi:hypothetical protein